MELTFWTVLKIGMAWVLAPIAVAIIIWLLVFAGLSVHHFINSRKRRR